MFKGQHYTDKMGQIQFQLDASCNSDMKPSILTKFKLNIIPDIHTQ